MPCAELNTRRCLVRAAPSAATISSRKARRANPGSSVELEQHDVAVLDDVFLAFVARLAGLLGGDLAAERDEIVISDRLRADEAALEVGVDDARRLRGLVALVHGPGARLLRPGGEIGDQVKQVVAGADQPVETRLVQAHRL